METDSAITFVTVVLCVVLLIRNNMVYRWRLRAADEAHALNVADIEAGIYVDLQSRYDLIPSYEAQLFDLTLWKYVSPFEKAA